MTPDEAAAVYRDALKILESETDYTLVGVMHGNICMVPLDNPLPYPQLIAAEFKTEPGTGITLKG